MGHYTKKQIIQKHHNYNIIFHSEEKLRELLPTWSRESIIDWLMWNDPNGNYSDEDSLREFDNILSKEDAIDLMIGQLTNESKHFKCSVKWYKPNQYKLVLNNSNRVIGYYPPSV